MVEPNYICDCSLMEDKVQIHGNVELAEVLKGIIKKYCIGFRELYESQEFMRNYCIGAYGADFYEKNAEAVQYIVENEYCHKERKNIPVFDMKQYEEDIRNGVVY